MSQRRVGFDGAPAEFAACARLRNHSPAATPSSVGTTSAGDGAGTREHGSRTDRPDDGEEHERQGRAGDGRARR